MEQRVATHLPIDVKKKKNEDQITRFRYLRSTKLPLNVCVFLCTKDVCNCIDDVCDRVLFRRVRKRKGIDLLLKMKMHIEGKCNMLYLVMKVIGKKININNTIL